MRHQRALQSSRSSLARVDFGHAVHLDLVSSNPRQGSISLPTKFRPLPQLHLPLLRQQLPPETQTDHLTIARNLEHM